MFITPMKEEITIMGTSIKIVIDTNRCELSSADGLYEAEVIYLKEEYSCAREYRRIFVHECTHALCDILGIQLDLHVEEILAHRISTMIAYELT